MTLAATATHANAAAVAAALQIQGENVDSTKRRTIRRTSHRPNYSLRRQHLARAVLDNPTNYTSRFAWAVAANPTIAATEPGAPSLENDIPYVITTVWDDLAGITQRDTQPIAPE